MSKRLGDAPIEPQYIKKMEIIAHSLDTIFNGEDKMQDRKVGFILLVFPFDEQGGRCNYISNGVDRRDVIVMLKEQIARFEGQPDIVGNA